MRKLISVGALAAATAFVSVLPVASQSAGASAPSPAPVSSATLTYYSPREYIYETIDSESDCNSDGAYMYSTGQASAYMCEENGADINGVSLYSLWLWPEGDGS